MEAFFCYNKSSPATEQPPAPHSACRRDRHYPIHQFGKVMAAEDLREHARVPVRWRAALIVNGDNNHVHKGLTVEISKGGCGLFIDKQILIGSNVRLILEIPGGPGGNKIHLQQECQVVHCSLMSNISQFRTGLRFRSLTAENEKTLSRFIRS